jgi:elongation factor Tu
MPTDPSFRMTIEDVFSIRGRGTVVVGCIEWGTLQVGDTVEIKGQIDVKRTVVAGIEMFRRPMDRVGVGDNVGVFLRNIGKDEVQRGDVLMGTQSDLDWADNRPPER